MPPGRPPPSISPSRPQLPNHLNKSSNTYEEEPQRKIEYFSEAWMNATLKDYDDPEKVKELNLGQRSNRWQFQYQSICSKIKRVYSELNAWSVASRIDSSQMKILKDINNILCDSYKDDNSQIAREYERNSVNTTKIITAKEKEAAKALFAALEVPFNTYIEFIERSNGKIKYDTDELDRIKLNILKWQKDHYYKFNFTITEAP